jgi:hypothetical protein
MPVKVHAWGNNDQSILKPFIWVETDQEDPAEAAKRILPLIKQKPIGFRTLFFRHALPHIDKSEAGKIIASGLGFDSYKLWFNTFFWEYRKLGGPIIDFIIVDEEDGISTWHWPDSAKAYKQIYDDPAVVRQLPKQLQGYAAKDFKLENRDVLIAWNTWASAYYNKAVYDSISEPSNKCLGYRPRFSQYNSVRFKVNDGSITDPNGWPIFDCPAGVTSSPSLYPDGTGNLFKDLPDAREKSLELALNWAKACKTPIVPWVPYPSYVTNDIFKKLIDGLKAMGITEFLYWNPKDGSHATEEDDIFAAAVFE